MEGGYLCVEVTAPGRPYLYVNPLNVEAQTSSGHGVALRRNGTDDLVAVAGTVGTQSSSAIAAVLSRRFRPMCSAPLR